MGNFSTDWGSDSARMEDITPTEIEEDQKRKVQALCVVQAGYDPEKALEFMHMLGIHPAQTAEVLPDGPPLPSPHLGSNRAVTVPGIFNQGGVG